VVCPYAHRARLALIETNTKAEEIEIDLRNKPEWYTKDINPAGKVPSLKLEDGQILVESLVITEYILEKYGPNTGIIPSDPLERAKTRLFIEQFNSFISAFYAFFIHGSEHDEESKNKLLAAIHQLNINLEALSKEGPYATGSQFTLADLISAPHLARLDSLKEYHRLTIPETSEYARVSAWIKTLAERPSVQSTLPSGAETKASLDRLRDRYATAASK
ncbi:glutathione S-transferase, partial [Syncephalis fuscata]